MHLPTCRQQGASEEMCAEYYVGTSGWSYNHWRGVFYPDGLPSGKWLEFYAQRFPSVELNASFYRLPTEGAFRRWHDVVPGGFRFAVKASRFITHIRKLRDAEESLGTFLGRAGILGEKLGPVLYQLPPSMGRDDGLLEAFLTLLPHGLQHVFEFRNDSWYDEGVLDLLRRHGAAFCVHDMHPLETPVVATAAFAYLRFHGTSGRYAGCYSDEELEAWAEAIRRMASGLETVYAYFNNDIGGHAVGNASTLARMLAGNGSAEAGDNVTR